MIGLGEKPASSPYITYCLDRIGQYQIPHQVVDSGSTRGVTPTTEDVAWLDHGADLSQVRSGPELERRALLVVQAEAAKQGLRDYAVNIFFNDERYPCFRISSAAADKIKSELIKKGISFRPISIARADWNVLRSEVKARFDLKRERLALLISDIQRALMGLASIDNSGIYHFRLVHSASEQLEGKEMIPQLLNRIVELRRVSDQEGPNNLSELTLAERDEHQAISRLMANAEQLLSALMKLKQKQYEAFIQQELYVLEGPQRKEMEQLKARLAFHNMGPPSNENRDQNLLLCRVEVLFNRAVTDFLYQFRFRDSIELQPLAAFGLLATFETIMQDECFRYSLFKRHETVTQVVRILESIAEQRSHPVDDLTYRFLVKIAGIREFVPIVRIGAAAMAAEIVGVERMKKDVGLNRSDLESLYGKAMSLTVMRPSALSAVLEPYAPAEFQNPVSIFNLFKKVEEFRARLSLTTVQPHKIYQPQEPTCESLAID